MSESKYLLSLHYHSHTSPADRSGILILTDDVWYNCDGLRLLSLVSHSINQCFHFRNKLMTQSQTYTKIFFVKMLLLIHRWPVNNNNNNNTNICKAHIVSIRAESEALKSTYLTKLTRTLLDFLRPIICYCFRLNCTVFKDIYQWSSSVDCKSASMERNCHHHSRLTASVDYAMSLSSTH